ncbi:glycosyltransferase family protein [Candidatus Uhrbacteria bacterium]|nr:glycosyltransferase family protein [Candidatus Uhrbacteria bacterium]
MNKVVCVIQARMGSTRLPGKTLMLLGGKPLLWHVVDRCRRAKKIDEVVVATTTAQADDAVAEFCAQEGFACFRGSEDNVLARYHGAAKEHGATTVIRVTGDCPLIDPETLDACVEAFSGGAFDYLSNALPGDRTYPRGLDVEVFSFAALDKAFQNATETYEKEHVAPYIWENKNGEFRIAPIVQAPPEFTRPFRLTVDYPEDFQVMTKIYDALSPEGAYVDTRAAFAFLDQHPDIAQLNAHCEEVWKQRVARKA